MTAFTACKHNKVMNCEKCIVEKIRDDVVKIVQESKATFFVAKGKKPPKIPKAEAMEELKYEICNNVEMYFVDLLK